MIRHIVMWKLKEHAEGGTRAENILKAQALLESCRDCVPGIVEFEVGVAASGMESNFDIVLNSTFENKAALHAYQEHPTHVALKPAMGAMRLERSCVDFEIQGAR
jgi:hypothetical protein